MPRDAYHRLYLSPRAGAPPRAPSPPLYQVRVDEWDLQPHPVPLRRRATSPGRRPPAPRDRDGDRQNHMRRGDSGYGNADYHGDAHLYGERHDDDHDRPPRLRHRRTRARSPAAAAPPEPRRPRPRHRSPTPPPPPRRRRPSLLAMVERDRGESSRRVGRHRRRSPSASSESSAHSYHDGGYHHDGGHRRLRRRASRSRLRSSSRAHSRAPSPPPRRGTDWASIGMNAARAGATAALHLRSEPGPWVGPKGARVGGAALAAALADALVVGKPAAEPKKGLRERAMRRVGEAAMAHFIPGRPRR